MEISTAVMISALAAAYYLWFRSITRFLKGPTLWPVLGSLPGLIQNSGRMHDWIADNLLGA
ncbi:hypothetical protein ABFS82_09G041500 [Erythranthe guttata]